MSLRLKFTLVFAALAGCLTLALFFLNDWMMARAIEASQEEKARLDVERIIQSELPTLQRVAGNYTAFLARDAHVVESVHYVTGVGFMDEIDEVLRRGVEDLGLSWLEVAGPEGQILASTVPGRAGSSLDPDLLGGLEAKASTSVLAFVQETGGFAVRAGARVNRIDKATGEEATIGLLHGGYDLDAKRLASFSADGTVLLLGPSSVSKSKGELVSAAAELARTAFRELHSACKLDKTSAACSATRFVSTRKAIGGPTLLFVAAPFRFDSDLPVGTVVVSKNEALGRTRFAELADFLRRARNIGMALTVSLCALLLLAVWGIVLRLFERRILALLAITDRLAEGDLSATFESGPEQGASKDEVERITHHLARMRLRLRDLLLGLGDASARLSAAGEGLDLAVSQQSRSLSEQASSIQGAHVTAQQIQETSLVASQKADAVLEAAARAETLTRDGEAAVEKTLRVFAEIGAQVQETAQRIADLEGRTKRIAGITATVKDLADQSNMLALNAGIEAARSGEHGRGFGAVAREIRSLADQSIQATQNVSEVLGDISSAIRSTVAITEGGKLKVVQGLKDVRDSGESLRELTRITDTNILAARQIAEAVGQQTIGVQQIFVTVTDHTKISEQTIRSLDATHAAGAVVKDVAEKVAEQLRQFKLGS